MRSSRPALIVVVVAALLAALPQTAAAWTAVTRSTGNTISTATTFPTYPTAVTRDGPWAYHRADDAVSATTSAAADASGNARTGTYNSASNGSSTRWTFDAGAPTAADASGAANPGSYGSATTSAAGHSGNAASMTGDTSGNGYVTGAAPAVATNASFTVSVWVYATAFTISRVALSQSGSTGSAFLLRYNHFGNRWEFAVSQAESYSPVYDSSYSAGAAPALNTWVQLTGVYDSTATGAQVQLYVNGTAQTAKAHTSVWNATGPLQAGRVREFGAWQTGSPAGWGPWAGLIDEVRTYRRALSASEVSTLYSSPSDPDMTAGLPGALKGAQLSSTAVAFAGTANAYNNTQVASPGPTAFTLECWFKASGTAGGVLVGFANDATGVASTSRDRVVYLDSASQLTFGTWPTTAAHTVRSAVAYNDGGWHYLAASLGAAGLKLYVDGTLVSSDATTTTAGSYAGYWRWGGGDTGLWPNRPANDYFTGTLDEVAVYHSQLSDQQIRVHYYANH